MQSRYWDPSVAIEKLATLRDSLTAKNVSETDIDAITLALRTDKEIDHLLSFDEKTIHFLSGKLVAKIFDRGRINSLLYIEKHLTFIQDKQLSPTEICDITARHGGANNLEALVQHYQLLKTIGFSHQEIIAIAGDVGGSHNLEGTVKYADYLLTHQFEGKHGKYTLTHDDISQIAKQRMGYLRLEMLVLCHRKNPNRHLEKNDVMKRLTQHGNWCGSVSKLLKIELIYCKQKKKIAPHEYEALSQPKSQKATKAELGLFEYFLAQLNKSGSEAASRTEDKQEKKSLKRKRESSSTVEISKILKQNETQTSQIAYHTRLTDQAIAETTRPTVTERPTEVPLAFSMPQQPYPFVAPNLFSFYQMTGLYTYFSNRTFGTTPPTIPQPTENERQEYFYSMRSNITHQ